MGSDPGIAPPSAIGHPSSMQGAPPPSAWADVGPARPSLPPALPSAAAAGPEAISASWKHVRNVVSADARPADLYDLLSHSVRETQYSFQPQGVSGRLGGLGRPMAHHGSLACRLAAAPPPSAAVFSLMHSVAGVVDVQFLGSLAEIATARLSPAAHSSIAATSAAHRRSFARHSPLFAAAAVALACAPAVPRDQRDAGHGAGALQCVPGVYACT